MRSRSSGGAGRLVLFYDVLDVVTGVHVFCIRRTGLHHIPRRGATCETCDFTFNQMTFMQPCYICLYHLTVITKLILYQSLQNCGGSFHTKMVDILVFGGTTAGLYGDCSASLV